jgi:hypothetical protein
MFLKRVRRVRRDCHQNEFFDRDHALIFQKTQLLCCARKSDYSGLENIIPKLMQIKNFSNHFLHFK